MIEPYTRFAELLDRAHQADIKEPTAMTLATVGVDGIPSARMVLLKSFDERGFTFYTNLESRKAAELARTPAAALCFHWQPLELQVRIRGTVERVSDDEADTYFASRPRGSQIGAWASLQSRPLPSRETLEERVREMEERFAGTNVPRPDIWSGYRVVPCEIEFWAARSSRLHEREVYTFDEPNDTWGVERLYP